MGLRSPKEIASLIAVCFSRRFPASLCPVSLRETPAASPNQASTVRGLLPSAKPNDVGAATELSGLYHMDWSRRSSPRRLVWGLVASELAPSVPDMGMYLLPERR